MVCCHIRRGAARLMCTWASWMVTLRRQWQWILGEYKCDGTDNFQGQRGILHEQSIKCRAATC